MLVAKLLIYILEAAFLVGIAGSVVVVTITFIEDMGEIFGEDENLESQGLPSKDLRTKHQAAD